MTERILTCVVCPAGCKVTVTLDDDGKITGIQGHTCPRGKIYAENEVTHPVRTLTSTVYIETEAGKRMLPVKTDAPIPKETLFDAMNLVRRYTAKAPVKTGDVLIENFIEEGTNLVACKDVE